MSLRDGNRPLRLSNKDIMFEKTNGQTLLALSDEQLRLLKIFVGGVSLHNFKDDTIDSYPRDYSLGDIEASYDFVCRLYDVL